MRRYKRELTFPEEHRRELLERYFGDLRMLFLKRFELFDIHTKIQGYDLRRLEELLREMIFIRTVLDSKGVVDKSKNIK
jgi:hypothetical protein